MRMRRAIPARVKRIPGCQPLFAAAAESTSGFGQRIQPIDADPRQVIELELNRL